MVWKIPEYTLSQVNKAGEVIRNSNLSPEDRENALIIVDNWRASHAYPLHILYLNLKKKCQNPKSIVAQRLKRLNSINSKLDRQPTMKLSQMQDLGGCRAIVSTTDEVYSLVHDLKSSRIRHLLKHEVDYIQNPRKSGYRSYHMVYQFQSDRNKTYNKNMLIEIQIRTHLQHYWATAVETMGLFTNQSLKASVGEEDLLRFFLLISSLFALKENQPLAPNTPNNVKDLISEIMIIDEEHNYLNMLSTLRIAIDHINTNKKHRKADYYLLVLNYKESSLQIKSYSKTEIEKATNDYNEIEKNTKNSETDAVLVSVSSFSSLKSAYPNYFYDIKKFVLSVRDFIP
jgi:Uncharacterized protein conserved in bacteria